MLANNLAAAAPSSPASPACCCHAEDSPSSCCTTSGSTESAFCGKNSGMQQSLLACSKHNGEAVCIWSMVSLLSLTVKAQKHAAKGLLASCYLKGRVACRAWLYTIRNILCALFHHSQDITSAATQLYLPGSPTERCRHLVWVALQPTPL